MSTVLADALTLCDAFTHVSKLDTCVALLQRIIEHEMSSSESRSGQCALFMREIYSHDKILAERVGERIAGYCAGILEDRRKDDLLGIFPEEAKQQAIVATSAACAILSVMQENSLDGNRRGSSAALELWKDFQKIAKLQSGCDVFLTLQELRDPSCCTSIVVDLLQPSVDLLLSRRGLLETEDDSLRNELKPLVATARQWCAIICGSSSEEGQRIWSRAVGAAASQVAKISTNHASLLLLEVSGLLDGKRSEHSAFHAVMSVALTLCARSFSEARHLSRSMSLNSQDDSDLLASLIAMRSMAQAAQLLREHVLLHSPPSMLSSSLSLVNLTELVSEISARADMGIGERLEKYTGMLRSASRKLHQQSYAPHVKLDSIRADKRLPSRPNLHPTWYIGDGLLLPPLEALFLSMSYCKMMLDIESGANPSESMLESSNPLMEKSEIIHLLESRGAHAASLRLLILLSSASMSQCGSSHRTDQMFANAENMLMKNNCVLAERSLGGTESGLTSGSIDALMSVSFLLHLPKEKAFKVRQLKKQHHIRSC